MKLLYTSLCVALCGFGLQAMDSSDFNFEFRSPVMEDAIRGIIKLEIQQELQRRNCFIPTRPEDAELMEALSRVSSNNSSDFSSDEFDTLIDEFYPVKSSSKKRKQNLISKKEIKSLQVYDKGSSIHLKAYKDKLRLPK